MNQYEITLSELKYLLTNGNVTLKKSKIELWLEK